LGGLAQSTGGAPPRDDTTNEAVVTIHWNGGRHTELRVPRVRTGRYPADRRPNPVEVIQKIGGHWPDYPVAMNRMRCKPADGKAWTTVRVRESRERLGIAPFDPASQTKQTICVDKAALRLGICVGSVYKPIREGVLPATQLIPSAPWQIPVAALETEAVKTGVQQIVARRPRNYQRLQDDKTLRRRDFEGEAHYVTRFPRRPRNTNRCPLWGLRLSTSYTCSASPSKPLRMSV
jgi:hypothetical protein